MTKLVNSVGGLNPTLLLALIWLSVGIAILFTIIRTGIRIHVYRRLFLDDGCIYFATSVLISMAVMYNVITETMFEIDAVSVGAIPAADFIKRAELFLKLQFAIICSFWTTLWAVKFSFLIYYKNLFAGLPNQLFWWWLVSGFALLAYLGCWATQLASCSPISNYFILGIAGVPEVNEDIWLIVPGGCERKRDIWVSNFSLYYSTAVDIICDILIMALPLRLLWNLRINRQQKSALAAIFSLGIIVVIFAIVRVVETSASIHHVDPVWLALWSMIEASIAVVVSCLPSFRVLLNTRSSRSVSAFTRRNPSSGRSRCSNKSWRLKPLKHGETSFEAGGHGGNNPQRTAHYAGAEHVTPEDEDAFVEAGQTTRADGSKEYILPKIPRPGVHVRKDVMVDFS